MSNGYEVALELHQLKGQLTNLDRQITQRKHELNELQRVYINVLKRQQELANQYPELHKALEQEFESEE